MCRNQRHVDDPRKDSEPMDRTVFAQHQAPVAAAARPYACAVSGIGFQWRNVANMAGLDTATTATKRPARHLEKVPT
jgi:hypothetical protein